MRSHRTVALAAAVLALAAGCSSSVSRHGCLSDLDCATGQVCIQSTGLCGALPPPAPSAPVNVKATIAFEQVVVTWDEAPRAATYDVYLATVDDLTGKSEGFGTYEGRALGTTFTCAVPYGWHFALFVQAVGEGGLSPISDPAVVERIDPGLLPANISVSPATHSLLVHWDPPAASSEPALAYLILASDVSGGPYAPLQSAAYPPPTSVRDMGSSGPLAPQATRYYRLRAYSRHFASPLSDELSGTTLPLPDAPMHLAAGRLDATTVALSWDGVGRAEAYDVRRDGKLIDALEWQLTSQDRSAPAFIDNYFPADGLVHTYAVRTVGDDYSAFSTPVAVLAVPPAPVGLTATAGEMRVRLRWTSVPTAESYVVSRGSAPDPLAPLVETTDVSFVDIGAPAWQQVYWVQSKNGAGVGPAGDSLATPFPDADQANLGNDALQTTPLDVAHSPAQTFVVGTAGVLTGVEVAASCAAAAGCALPTIEIDSGGLPVATGYPAWSLEPFPCCTPAALAPGWHGRAYFPIPDGLPVSAGQRLRLVVDSSSEMLAGTTPDLYTGGMLEEGGEPAPTRDLVFRTEVLPATGDPTQPGTPLLTYGVGQVRIAWTPAPLALSYTVLRSSDGSAFSPVGSTVDAWFVDMGARPGEPVYYEVQAVGASGPARVSPMLKGMLPAWALVASNLAVTGKASASDDLGQTFTASTSGLIRRVELALAAAPGGSATHGSFLVDILDAGGTLLATSAPAGGRVASCCGLAPDLSAGAFGTASADFYEPLIPVAAGQQLKLRLRAQSPLVAGISADAYSGGTLTVGGNPDPSRDLVFKVVVQ